MTIGAGDLFQSVAFDSPVVSPDGFGGRNDGWAEQLQARAHFRFLRGGEAVQAARLAGRQPVVVTIRSSAAARAITPAWRMRDLNAGEVYNIRAIVPTDDRRFLELTCESGVAV